MAENIDFNEKCLAVPSGERLWVDFVNRDFVEHNLAIYSLDLSSVFSGDVAFPAERFSYRVPALESGEYLFQCDIHPEDMFGPLLVQ